MTTAEEWRSVPSHELLEASSEGRVRSVPYQIPVPRGRGVRTYQMNPTFGVTQKMSANYARKIIVFRRKSYKVATLVAEAFLGPRPEGLDISHKDENSFNNKPDNLEYVTRKKNMNMPKMKDWQRTRTGDNSLWAIHRRK